MILDNLGILLDEALGKLPPDMRAEINAFKTKAISTATDESKSSEERKIDIEYLQSKITAKYGTKDSK